MPSLFSHIAVPIAGRFALGKAAIPPSLLLLGLLVSVLPDADVALLRLGVPYESQFGHRGFTHSLAFSLFVAACVGGAHARLKNVGFRGPFLYLALCAISHPLLDLCTNGGHGAAILWPLSDERYFFWFRPIEASPLSIRRFFGEPGLRVLLSELAWVWLPCFVSAIVLAKVRGAKNAA